MWKWPVSCLRFTNAENTPSPFPVQSSAQHTVRSLALYFRRILKQSYTNLPQYEQPGPVKHKVPKYICSSYRVTCLSISFHVLLCLAVRSITGQTLTWDYRGPLCLNFIAEHSDSSGLNANMYLIQIYRQRN
jgi:hypothetical protein